MARLVQDITKDLLNKGGHMVISYDCGWAMIAKYNKQNIVEKFIYLEDRRV